MAANVSLLKQLFFEATLMEISLSFIDFDFELETLWTSMAAFTSR